MKYDELEELAKEGKILVHKYKGIKYFRNRYIWGKKHTSEDISKDEYYKIWKVKKELVQKWHYHCRTLDMPEHQSYKITSKDFKGLLKAGAKEEF
jgi:hypothetical protein